MAAELEEYRQVLIRHHGFAERDIRVLLDRQATKSAIQSAFQEHLIEQVRPGDVALFHFSGHGQHLPDDVDLAQRDEVDGLDESLVPYDALDQSVQEGQVKNLRDDELGAWLEHLAARMRPSPERAITGNITVTLDACFSGSATRGGLIARGRAWDVSRDGPLPVLDGHRVKDGGAGLLPQSLAAQRDVVVLAAARADQAAWERNGRGVFTRHWTRLLAQMNSETPLTYRAAADRLILDLAAEGLDQMPQTEGNDRQVIFSGTATGRAAPSLRAYFRDEGALWLAAGEIHGVTLGSEYRLYDAGESIREVPAHWGQARVDEVQPFTSRLTLLPGTQRGNRAGGLAVESRHVYRQARLRLALVNWNGVAEVRKRILALGNLDVVDVKDSAAAGWPEHDVALVFQPLGQTVQFYARDGSTRLGNVSTQDGTPKLEDKLRSLAHWKHLAELRRDNSDARVDAEVLPFDGRRNAHGDFVSDLSLLPIPSPAAHIRLRRGMAICVRLLNRSSRSLYVAVLALSPDGDINVLFGKGRDKSRVAAHARLEPTQDQMFQLTGQPGDRIVLKIIATDRFVDFTSLDLGRSAEPAKGVRSSSLVTDDPLSALFNSPDLGTRSSAALGPSVWGTTDASVQIE